MVETYNYKRKFYYKRNNFMNIKKRVAICLKGAMSKRTGNLHTKELFDQYTLNKPNYCDFVSVYNCFLEHIIKPNIEKYDIDIFLQSWNPDLQEQLINLYKPVSYLFEDNNLYSNEFQKHIAENDYLHKYAWASSSLAIKKSIELKEEYENKNNLKYDLVLIYRPDLILIKDMNFDNYNVENGVVYSNYTNINLVVPKAGQGEYYWIMSNETSNKFKLIYEADYKDKFLVHQGAYYFIKDVVGSEEKNDDIRHGVDVTAARTEMLIDLQPGVNLKKYGFNF